jgi:DNA-directed RNA polymerase specialized sigma24 family protein
MEQERFEQLIRQLREGYAAEKQLVDLYTKEIERLCRFKLQDNILGRLVEPEDVCQSVFRTFFRRLRKGEFHLASAKGLGQLLAEIARNRIAALGRRDKRVRIVAEDPEALADYPSIAANPLEEVAARDLEQSVQSRLTREEWELFELRRQGLSWEEIRARKGGTAEGRRKQLFRALRRLPPLAGGRGSDELIP